MSKDPGDTRRVGRELAACGVLAPWLQRVGEALDDYLRFEHPDAMQRADSWRQALQQSLPQHGIGADGVVDELVRVLIPNGSQVSNPAFSAYITTGASSVGVLANLAGDVAAPQRLGVTAFNLLEELSLDWLAELLELPDQMKGLYTSGGSVANLVALGGARQWAFERLGADPARDGVHDRCRIYATAACHHTIQRAAAVLGMGRMAVRTVASDDDGRMLPGELERRLQADAPGAGVPVAIVANAGTTSAGAIDPLRAIGSIARRYGVWFHVDGAYGLPGVLDPRVRPLYDGLELADSVIVDPHKWLGAPVGIGAVFVRDRSILHRAFTQEASDYLEGSLSPDDIQHSMDDLGIPYSDFGVELSSPSRGVVVWALLREVGREGMRQRICRHNDMARHVARRADAEAELEVVQPPTLSICCLRYVADSADDLNSLNRRIHRQMVRRGRSMPSTAMIDGKLAIRPCFVGARAEFRHADELVDELLVVGRQLVQG